MDITYDSLTAFEELKKAGIPENQARVQVEVFQKLNKSHEALKDERMATKADILELRREMDIKFVEMNEKITSLDVKLGDTKHEILKWTIGMFLGLATLMVALFGVSMAMLAK